MTRPDPRYPIGRFHFPGGDAASLRAGWIDEIEALPAQISAEVARLGGSSLDTPYRPGGWTPRQVVHHLPDSHLQAYSRFKLALTEDEPTIRPYDEARWADLADTALTPPEVSVQLLTALHRRWVVLLRAMGDADFQRGYHHPEQGRTVRLEEALAMYAWHGRHHLAHLAGVASGAHR